MFCQKCGTKALDGAAFCQKCGAKLYNEETVNRQSDMSATNKETTSDKFDVTLTHVGTDKVSVIKKVRELTGLGLKEAKELVSKVPVLLKEVVPQAEAESIKAELMEVGSEVTFTSREGCCVEIAIHCKVCGKVLNDGSVTCKACGNTFADAPSAKEPPTLFDGFEWINLFDKFTAMSSAMKVLSVLGALLAASLIILILIVIIRLIFSSIVTVIVIAAAGYVAYHKWGAISVTRHKYSKTSKDLLLPDGMTSQALLEELNGKFNYPYFKGIRYGENGECIIEGRYSVYPVVFDKNNKASLTCSLKVDEKKLRATMLEAIAIRSYINKFFNPTLPYDAVKDLKSLKSAEKQRQAIAIVLSVASTLIIVIIALEYAIPGSLQRVIKPGIEVREAYLTEYSKTVTVEIAFDYFFDNEKWSTYEAEGYSYVAFTGACEFMEEKADIRITFKITGEQFLVDSLDVNGREQGDLMLYSLLSKIYENYEEE